MSSATHELSVGPYVDVQQFTTFTSDLDLTAQTGFPQRPARALRVEDVTGGTTLAIQMTESAADRTLTVAAGDLIEGTIHKIDNTTDVARVTVWW